MILEVFLQKLWQQRVPAYMTQQHYHNHSVLHKLTLSDCEIPDTEVHAAKPAGWLQMPGITIIITYARCYLKDSLASISETKHRQETFTYIMDCKPSA